MTDDTIKSKKDSFLPLKEGAMWIKENSNPIDTILTSSSPMMLYYSERKIVNFPDKEEELTSLILEKRPKYMVVSIFTGNPNYINNLMNYTYFKPVKTYQSENFFLLAIFEIEYDKINIS